MKNFFTLDLRSLALWRIGLGSVVLLDILLRLRDLQAFYGDAGVLPRQTTFEQEWLSSVYHLFLAAGQTPGLLFLFAIWIAAAVCMVVGYQTRIACLVTWYFVVSIQLRNPLVMDGGDDFLRVLLFWTPFLPLSARWSLDAQRNERWKELPNQYASLATAAIYLQFFLFYLFAALLKTGDDWLKTSDALYYALSIDQFVTLLGQKMVPYVEFLRVLTKLALGLEFLLPALLISSLWSRKARILFLLLAATFHLSIAALLHFGIFMLIMLVSLLVFIPGDWLKTLPGRLAKLKSTAAILPTSTLESESPPGYNLGVAAKAFAVFIMGYMIFVNIYSIEHRQKLAPWAHTVARYTYQHQHWHFFAPYPFRDDGYFQILVETEDGKSTDILKRGEVDESGRPLLGSERFPNQRWRRWMQNLVRFETADHPAFRYQTLLFLVKEWQKQHPEKKIKSARFLFVLEYTQPPGEPTKPEVIELAQWSPT